MVVDDVLQDPLKQHRQLGRWLIGVLLGQLEHGVLNDVQSAVVVSGRVNGLFEGPALD